MSRTQEEIEAIKELVLEVERRGIVLTASFEEWLSMAYSLAEGGEEMRPSFHTLARMGGSYRYKDSNKAFTTALRKTATTPQSHQEMSLFLSKCWEAGLHFPEVLMTSSKRNGAAAAVKVTSSPSPTVRMTDRSGSSEVCLIDTCWVQRCRSNASSFFQSLVETKLLTASQAVRAANRYRLGAMRDGSVIYWQIDALGRVRDGKVMMYGQDCHRLKSVNPNWMSWLMRYKLRDARGQLLLPMLWRAERCLFGLHLLAEARPDQTICVVEAEKTAVICSERVDADCIWMASGGLSALRARLLEPLRGHRVILYPDTDSTGETFQLWSKVADEARLELGVEVSVSDILECGASEEQKGRKVDLVEWVTEGETHAPQPLSQQTHPRPLPSGGGCMDSGDSVRSDGLVQLVREHPDLDGLIETFQLVEC